jgi:hypothetical protein
MVLVKEYVSATRSGRTRSVETLPYFTTKKQGAGPGLFVSRKLIAQTRRLHRFRVEP